MGPARPSSPRSIRFGVYELDLQAGELRRQGVKVKLQEQPFQILHMLLERPGEVVTREEIQRKLWPADTFVDFEHGINAAVKRLREALDDSADNPRFIETLARRGYRFIAPVETARRAVSEEETFQRNDSTAAWVGAVPPVAQSLRVTGHESPLLRGWVVAMAAVAICASLGLMLASNIAGLRDRIITLLGTRRSVPLPKIESIAVLPLENLSHDPDEEYFADGMTDALIMNLGKIGALRVISRTSVMGYKRSRKRLPEIARELSVDAAVEGAVVRSGNRVRITANLLYAPADRHLWGETYERDLGDILSLQQEVARAIAREVNATLSHQEEANLTKPRPIKPEALEAYLRGQAYAESATEPALKNSVAYLKRAIEIDPDYAPAYAALGEVYYSLADLSYMPDKEAYALEEKAASKAFKLDETLVDAQVELAVLKEYYDWDELGAEREYRRIVTMNPNHAGARLRFAYNLAKMGQRGESLAEFRHWQELDPVAAASGKPVLYYFIRQYDQAIEECRKVLVIDPTSRDHSWLLGLAYVQKGRFEEAIEELQKAVEYSGGSPLHKASLAYAYAVSGRRHGALRLIEELKQRRAKGGYVSAYDIAVAYAGLNEKDLVLQWLNKAFEERAGGLPWVKVDPRLDLMRSDARFRDLLHRMNFPP